MSNSFLTKKFLSANNKYNIIVLQTTKVIQIIN